MDAVTITVSVLTLLAGIGVFLIACSMMSSNLEALGSGKLKSLFAKTSKSKLLGVGAGALATMAIQSSSATTVMVIGFVNAGIMTLYQAATVIFGANIGTTITGQLVALGMFGDGGVSTSVIFSALAGFGAFILAFAKKDVLRKAGGILAGFGMLFVGLSLMSGSMQTFSESPEVRSFLSTFENPFLLVLLGALFTAIIQSSSAMTSMAIAMVVTGLISLEQGIYITMGSNVGTCVTALIAGITSSRNAKRTAVIHLIFNVSGTVVFMLIGIFMGLGGISYGYIFEIMFPHAPQVQLAMFHTVFNLITVIIILPLTNILVKLVVKIIPDKKKDDTNEPRLSYVDERMLKTPPVAVQQTKNEIIKMAETSIYNFNLSCDIICSLDFKDAEKFKSNEEHLNFINKELVSFIVKLMKADLNEQDRIYLSRAIRSVSDLERVGDYAENIVEYAEKLKSSSEKFSEEVVKEIAALKLWVNRLSERVMKTYVDRDVKALGEAYAIENKIDEITAQMTEGHIERLRNGSCTPEAGAMYLAFCSDAERVADHFINVANTVKAG